MVKTTKTLKMMAATLSIVMLFECVPITVWGITLNNTQSLGGLVDKITDNLGTNVLKKNAVKKELTAPQNIWASSVRDTSMYIYWSNALNNEGIVEYTLYMNGLLVKTTTRKNAQVTGLTKGQEYTFYVVARDKATNKTARSKSLQQKTENYHATLEKRNNDVAATSQKADNLYEKYVSKPVSSKITTDTSWVEKVAWGALEGIPKTVKEVGMFGYSTAKYLTPDNAVASGMVNYAKLKNDPINAIKSAGHTVAALPGVLYQESSNCLKRASKDPRYAGNLIGEFGTCLGVLKAASKVSKGASLTAQVSKTTGETGSVLKMSKARIGVLSEGNTLKLSNTKIAVGRSPAECLKELQKELEKGWNFQVLKDYKLPVALEEMELNTAKVNSFRRVLASNKGEYAKLVELETLLHESWKLRAAGCCETSKFLPNACQINSEAIAKVTQSLLHNTK